MEIKNMPEVMADIAVDLQDPNRMLISGLFRETAKDGSREREFLTYIPENTHNGQPCIVVAMPSGSNPGEVLEKTGLKAFADERKYLIHLVPAADNGWRLDGTDAMFLNTVYVAVNSRRYYVALQDNMFLLGLGDGADAAQQAAKNMASEWSGLITIGDLTLDLREDHSTAMQEQDQGSGELKIQAMRAQLPVWMFVSELSGANAGTAEYWRGENKNLPEPLSGQGADYIWMPSPVRAQSEINEEHIAEVRVTTGTTECIRQTLETAWSYIGLARRHRGIGKKFLRYNKDPLALGATLHTLEVNGMMRKWYEYVPDTCTPDQSWPLAVVMHGRGGTAETFFEISCMSVVARERRFIAVFPEAGIYQQFQGGLRNILLWCGEYQGKPIDDIQFIRAMVDDVRARNKVDNGRIYACGQSSGGMMTDLLNNCAGDLFTATASWSALRAPKRMYADFPETKDPCPTMYIFGELDPLNASKTPDPEFPFNLTAEMKEQVLGKMKRYGLKLEDVQIWDDYPIHWAAFPNAQGVPMLVIGMVHNMAHANYPEESGISYDQYLCGFHKDADGALYWRGKKVIVPEQ